MKRSDKIFEVQNLSAKIKDAKSVALVDYRGLTVAQITDLRNKVKDFGGELQVVKNRLFYRALKENKYKISKDELSGTTLALFANADEISPLKALVSFGKTLSLLPLKIGFMKGKIVSVEDLNKYAILPTKLELQTKLVGMLASPPTRLVYALNWNIQKLVLILNGVKNRQEVRPN